MPGSQEGRLIWSALIRTIADPSYTAVLEAGGVTIGEEVSITIDFELTLKWEERNPHGEK